MAGDQLSYTATVPQEKVLQENLLHPEQMFPSAATK